MKKISKNQSIKVNKIYALALENHEKNNFKTALNLYQDIIKIDPYHASSYYNLGLVFQRLREFNKAKDFYKKAIEIKPMALDAHNNLGLIFKELNDLENAALCYQRAINIDSNYVNSIFNLGVVFREQGEFKKSIDCYEKVIKIKPNFAKVHNNIGNVYKKLGENKKAISHFKEALEINPNSIDAQVNISNVYISQLSDPKKAIEASMKSLKMHHEKSQFINNSVSVYRLKHDMQQAKHLMSEKYNIDGIDHFIKVSKKILDRNENKEDNNDSYKKINLSAHEIEALLPYYKKNFIYKTPNIFTGCVNLKKNWKKIEEEYFGSNKQIIYIDNFLSDKAVEQLRKFCLNSKIWIEERRNKYLGSFSDKGFISPIHLKIANELKDKLPKIFGKHRLSRFWAFKYDSFLGKGINIHADFASVNLNFWITPDEFNNNKNTGGLKVYDMPAPKDWTFQKYNMNSDEIYKTLKKNKANCSTIPYRFNRAVLFNSDYFHETDEIDFKDTYVGRRINITYLFGDRLFKKNSYTSSI